MHTERPGDGRKTAAAQTAEKKLFAEAIAEIDDAVRLWPQYWGLRFEDLGLRLGWFLRPFGINMSEETQNPRWLLERQIYDIPYTEPYKAFMDITPAQSAEIGEYYNRMADMIASAIDKFARIATNDGVASEFVKRQSIPARTLLGFVRTFGNMFSFYGYKNSNAYSEDFKNAAMAECVRKEIANIGDLIAVLLECPQALITADKAWGQCVGRDTVEKLTWKRNVMQETL